MRAPLSSIRWQCTDARTRRAASFSVRKRAACSRFSLGGIVNRADVVQAQRHYALTSQEDRRRELKRIEKALDDLGHFVPTDEEAVKAARRAADAAAISRQAECGTTEKQR